MDAGHEGRWTTGHQYDPMVTLRRSWREVRRERVDDHSNFDQAMEASLSGDVLKNLVVPV